MGTSHAPIGGTNPVFVVPLKPDASEDTGTAPVTNPEVGSYASDTELLRGMMASLRDINSSLRDIFQELRTHSAILGASAGLNPEDYRTG